MLPRPLARRALLLLLQACALGAAAAPEACAPVAARDGPSAMPGPPEAASSATPSPVASSPVASSPVASAAPAASSEGGGPSPYLGATAAEVRAALGAPREVRRRVWVYVRETLDCDRRFTTEMTFQGGRVVDVKETRTWTGKTCL